MKLIIKIIGFLLFVFPINIIYSQSPSYIKKNYTTDNGLPNNKIYCTTRDQFGFLWIATWDGVACYDGLTFKNYYHVPGDSTTIPYFESLDLIVDVKNNVWILARYISRYDRTANRFITFSPSSKNYIYSTTIYSMATDKDGNLFVQGNRGVERYNYKSGHFDIVKVFNNKGKIDSIKGLYIAIDERNNLYAFKNNRLYTGKLIQTGDGNRTFLIIQSEYTADFFITSFLNFFIRYKVINTDKKRIWIVSNNGLYYKNTGSNQFKEYLSEKDSTAILPEGKEFVWSKLGKGLFHYNPKSNRVLHYAHDVTQYIETSYLDRDGIIWYGSIYQSGEGTGLSEIVETRNSFKYFPDKDPDKNLDLIVFSILKDFNKNLWIGIKNYNWLVKVLPDRRIENKYNLGKALLKIGNNPRAIVEDEFHNLWIGYFNDLLMKYEYNKNKFIHYYPGLLKDKKISFMHQFKNIKILANNNILTAGNEGICIINPESNKVLYCFINNFLSFQDIYSVYINEHQKLWFGTNGKLVNFSEKLQPIKTIPVANGLYNIESICKDTLNSVWLALLGGGLCNFDLETYRSTYYTTSKGLPNNTTYSILKDKKGNLWISTDQGISMFNPKTQQFVNYGMSDGLKIEEFNSHAFFLSNDGEMFFGGMGGVVSFYPDSLMIHEKITDPPIIIRNLEVLIGSDKEYIPVFTKNHLLLSKGTRNIRTHFSCLDFRPSGKSHIRYRIMGFKEDWEIIDNSTRVIQLIGLKPGYYEIQLEATNLNGEWIRKSFLSITIPPFFYETLWFRYSAEVVIFIVLLSFVIMQLRNLQLQHKHRLAQLRIITMQGQLNPHFMSNSLSAIESFIPSKGESTGNRYISEVSRLMRTMIDYSNKEYVPFKDELELIERYLKAEQIRTGLSFDYEIKTIGIDVERFRIAPSMIQTFIENIIKHGLPLLQNRKGEIIIDFERPIKDHIVCIVRDNGIGIEKSARLKRSQIRASKGIEIIKERLRLYNSIHKTKLKLNISAQFPDEDDKGTIITIDIPIKVPCK